MSYLLQFKEKGTVWIAGIEGNFTASVKISQLLFGSRNLLSSSLLCGTLSFLAFITALSADLLVQQRLSSEGEQLLLFSLMLSKKTSCLSACMSGSKMSPPDEGSSPCYCEDGLTRGKETQKCRLELP